VKQRTSVIPFLAIFDGRQTLKWQEFLRPAYLGVTGFTLLFWWAHPWLLQVTSKVQW
nr:NnrU family protein [Xenococcaceae cyanobacterium MO_188.B19]